MIDPKITAAVLSETNGDDAELIRYAKIDSPLDADAAVALIRRGSTFYVVVYEPTASHEFHDDENRHAIMTSFTDDLNEAIGDFNEYVPNP